MLKGDPGRAIGHDTWATDVQELFLRRSDAARRTERNHSKSPLSFEVVDLPVLENTADRLV